MSDRRLRELERRWRETRSVDDEAAYLRERVRVGDLTQERLELAAYCGHPGALRTTNSSADERALFPWFKGLKTQGHEACSRSAIAAAKTASKGARDLTLIAALEAWAACPCNSCLSLASVAAQEAAKHCESTALLAYDACREEHPIRAWNSAALVVRQAATTLPHGTVLSSIKEALISWALSGSRSSPPSMSP